MHFGGLNPDQNPNSNPQTSTYPEATTHQTGSTTYEQHQQQPQVYPQHTGVSEIGQAPPVYQTPDEKTATAGYTHPQATAQSPAPQTYGYDGGAAQGYGQQQQQQGVHQAAPEAIHMNSYPSQQSVPGQNQAHGVDAAGYYDGKTANGQPQSQTQYQQQGQTQGNRYQNAVPLANLQSAAAPVDCPMCGKREMTRTEFVSGSTTHVSALLLCCFVCLGCIPYMASWFKDVEHKCGSCGAMLAVWHRSGRTEVLAHR